MVTEQDSSVTTTCSAPSTGKPRQQSKPPHQKSSVVRCSRSTPPSTGPIRHFSTESYINTPSTPQKWGTETIISTVFTSKPPLNGIAFSTSKTQNSGFTTNGRSKNSASR